MPLPPSRKPARALPLPHPALLALVLACGVLPAARAEAPPGRPGEPLAAPAPGAPSGGAPLRKDAPAPTPAPPLEDQAARPAAPPASAEDADRTAAAATRAQQGIEAGLALERLRPEAGGTLPMLDDPEAGPLLRRLLDSEAVVALRPVGTAAAPALAGWSEAAQRLLARYAARLRDPATRGATAVALQEEITLASVFVFRISATLFQPAVARATARPGGADPVRARLSRASTQSVGGMLTILSDRGLTVENARPIAAALAEDVALLRPAMPDEGRMPLIARTAALLVQHQDEAVRRDLRTLQERLREGG
ncbi:hypothetical protein [Pseudoroseomonas cervicalis]|uniref:hypothetical protein n=1 Tax=Teichococcus cervicalis TaxID=204525 RepID=UPI0022F1CAFA|nr:hypothetical protein [Pseudoroseomonas cervicalis]WBV43917.1 hypothetical protein PFY06_04940 [Pseudoroseomonas cervicalis]